MKSSASESVENGGFNLERLSANKEETLRLLEGLIEYQQPSKASTWNRQEAQAHVQR